MAAQRYRSNGLGCRVVKRVLDLVVAAALVVMLAPLLAVLAVAVAATSPGGPLFVQQRAGRDERWFPLVKFRTMRSGAETEQADLEHRNELDGAVFGIRDDPRVTPIGRVLRRTSLDELSQLWNVLVGDMSLVGPRPLPERDHSLLSAEERRRTSVKPGITGRAQIEGRNELSFADMMAFDLDYVRTCSLLQDLTILARTPKAVLSRRGAS